MAKAYTTERTDQARPCVSAMVLPSYLITAVLIRLADEGARVALVLLALERTDSAAVGGLLVAALLVPQALAALAIGLLTDRARLPRWVLCRPRCSPLARGLGSPWQQLVPQSAALWLASRVPAY